MTKHRLRSQFWAEYHGYAKITENYYIPREEDIFLIAVRQLGDADIQFVKTGDSPMTLQIWRKERECQFGVMKDDRVWMED